MSGMAQWSDAIAQEGQQYNVDPQLIAAVIRTESNGNPNAYAPESAQAVKSGGASGLGQQTPATAKALGIDPTDPYQSIAGVAKLLDENLRRYGNPQQAILAYHGGTDPANWGQRTQAYLAKVSNAYGAPQTMAQPARQDYSGLKPPPAQAQGDIPDYFSQTYGAAPSAVQAPAEGIPDYFSETFGPQAAPAATVPTNAAPVSPTAAPQAAQPPGVIDSLMSGNIPGAVEAYGRQGIANANAIGQGISESFDAPSEWLASGAEKIGLTGPLKKAGINMPTGAEQQAINAAARQAYDARNPDAGIQGALSRAGGNLAGVMIPLAGGEMALTKGAGMAADALNVSPQVAAKVGTFLKGEGGLASRMVYNAVQGGAGGALLSGGQPGVSTGDAALHGALFGAALPVAGAVAGYGKNLVQSAVAPFTAGGRDRIATQMLQKQAAKYSPAAAQMDDAARIAADQAPGETPALQQALGGTPVPRSGAAPTSSTALTPGGAGYTAPATGGTADTAVSRAAAGGRTAADFTEYVPGSKPTLAQATGNGGIAALERAAKGRAPNEFTERELQNYAARNSFFEGIKGTPETLAEATAAREAATAPLREASLQGARPANTNPVIATIDDILKSPEGQRKSVTNALSEVRSKLDLGENGAQSDVAQLYGIRKSINDQLEMVAGRDNSAAQQASRQLIQVRDALDTAMEKAAPGFANYRQTYAEMSKPVNSQTFLQNLNLTDSASNRITLPKVKAAIDKIEKLRNAPGANEAKSISDEQLAGLRNLHMDLQREANSARGMSIGSNTFQNLATNQLIDSIAPGKAGAVIGGVSPAGVGGALGYALGGPVGSGIGALLGQQAGAMGARAMNAQGPEIEAKLIDYLLNPKNAEVLAPKGNGATTSLLKILSRSAPTGGQAK